MYMYIQPVPYTISEFVLSPDLTIYVYVMYLECIHGWYYIISHLESENSKTCFGIMYGACVLVWV